MPDPKAETNHYEIAMPTLGSLILTHEWNGEIKGLKSFPPEDRPEPDHPVLRLPHHGRHRPDHDRRRHRRRGAVAHRAPLYQPLVPAHAGLGLAARLPRRARRLVHRRGRPPALDRLWRVAHGRRGVAGSRRQRALLASFCSCSSTASCSAPGSTTLPSSCSRGPDETPPVPEEGEADLSHRPMAAAGNP